MLHTCQKENQRPPQQLSGCYLNGRLAIPKDICTGYCGAGHRLPGSFYPAVSPRLSFITQAHSVPATQKLFWALGWGPTLSNSTCFPYSVTIGSKWGCLFLTQVFCTAKIGMAFSQWVWSSTAQTQLSWFQVEWTETPLCLWGTHTSTQPAWVAHTFTKNRIEWSTGSPLYVMTKGSCKGLPAHLAGS